MSNVQRLLKIAAAALAAAAPLAAQQPAAARTITYEEAIGLALSQNIGVKQAENASSLSEAAVKQQKLALLPDLRLSVSGANNIGRNFSQSDGAIINQQTQSLSSGVSSSFTLFDGGKTLAGIRSAQQSQAASEQDLARARQTAVFTVATNYVALANQTEQLRVQKENLAAQEAQLALVQQYVRAGAKPVSDQYQQEAAVASAKLSVAQANRAVELAKVDLMQTLQLDPAANYNFVAPPFSASTSTAPTPTLAALIAKAYDARADLDAQEARAAAAAQDVKAAKSGHLPSVSLSGSYSSAYSSASTLGLADQLDQRRGGSIGVGVSIPVFDRGATNVAEQRAKIAEDNARLALANEKQAVAIEVRRAWLDQASAKEQLAAAEAQIAAATQAVDVAQQRYRAGASSLIEVTQARATQTQAASAVATARNNLALQETVMAYYTGELRAESK
jgi:outer membrane protein